VTSDRRSALPFWSATLAAMPVAARQAALVRALRHGLSASGLMVVGYVLLIVAPRLGTFGFDAFAYWAVESGNPYAREVVGGLGFFGYSPAFAQAIGPLGSLPWPVFISIWSALLIGTLVWLGGRWTLVWLCFVPVVAELYHGNIHLLLAAAIVLGFRHPWAWVFVLLTKLTPGIGLAWFMVRREWRSLVVALGATTVVIGVSWAANPGAWSDWVRLGLSGESGPCGTRCLDIPLLARGPIALALVVLGARTNRRWLVPVGAMLALPVLWVTGLAMLVGAGALMIRDRTRVTAGHSTP
jgi:hypothetical protein